MTDIYERPSKEISLDGDTYKIVAYPAMTGLDFQYKMGQGITPELIRDMVFKGCSKGGMSFNQESFDKTFSGKLPKLMKLFEAIAEFNYTDPLDESDSGSL